MTSSASSDLRNLVSAPRPGGGYEKILGVHWSYRKMQVPHSVAKDLDICVETQVVRSRPAESCAFVAFLA